MNRNTFVNTATDARFREEGYVILDLLTPEDVEQLLQFYRSYGTQHEDGFTASVLLPDTRTRKRIHDGISTIFAERLLRVFDNHRIAVASFAVKQAACDYSNVGLHQDLTFVEEPAQVGVSLWCPLVQVTEENGWLGVVPGSHVFNSYYREPCSLPYPDLIDTIEAKYLTYLPMRPGQALLMDNRLFHGSPSNRSDHPRIVAAGIAVPQESRLLYCHRFYQQDDAMLEVWEVPEDFYQRHQIGQRPEEGRHVATSQRLVADLTETQLREHYEKVVARQRQSLSIVG